MEFGGIRLLINLESGGKQQTQERKHHSEISGNIQPFSKITGYFLNRLPVQPSLTGDGSYNYSYNLSV